MKYKYYEAVRVNSGLAETRTIDKKKGLIIGYSTDDVTGSDVYAVTIIEEQETWMVSESELETLGIFLTEDEYQSSDYRKFCDS
ncbi:Imm31 family immunity protein [Pseudidiomarina sp. GXY010]|uniref:Imm31 family immunity protein n=2 Tax=Pseudidiomarina TaxID=2800384 RepID=A0AB39XCH2_9GAMM|nr:Imm31 family immunity protein [Pseudidiomarina sp. GXY010]MDT7527028.1 Imm31 family immunity protein [Pseudidiomarina sp. GXY010]